LSEKKRAAATKAVAKRACRSDHQALSFPDTRRSQRDRSDLDANAAARRAAGVARGHGARQGAAFQAWSPDDRLMLGILEPSPAAAEVIPDIMLLPLAAFDRLGHRIGYGGGYYDYTLAHLRKVKAVTAIGLAFAAQEIEAIPALSHDVALDYVLTETAVFDFRS
jgi:5-formyltetrahydrofolate cyclo-ligase